VSCRLAILSHILILREGQLLIVPRPQRPGWSERCGLGRVLRAGCIAGLKPHSLSGGEGSYTAPGTAMPQSAATAPEAVAPIGTPTDGSGRSIPGQACHSADGPHTTGLRAKRPDP